MTEESACKAIELTRHLKVAKWAVGAFAGYVATEFAEKGFDIALAAYRRRKSG